MAERYVGPIVDPLILTPLLFLDQYLSGFILMAPGLAGQPYIIYGWYPTIRKARKAAERMGGPITPIPIYKRNGLQSDTLAAVLWQLLPF